MASAGPREPAGEGIRLSADVKPFVPKFAGLGVPWQESSEAPAFPSGATAYYPSVQGLPVPGQKVYAEEATFGASPLPPQYLSSEIALPPYACSSYTLEAAQNVCPAPRSQYDYGQPSCYRGFPTGKPRHDHRCPLPQDSRALLKKKVYDEQKLDSKKADGTVSAKGPHTVSMRAEHSPTPDGYQKRTDRKSRIPESSGPTSNPEFEFTRLDFPELPGPENSERSEAPRQPKWGPAHPASSDLSLLREAGKPAALAPESKAAPGGSPEPNDASRKNKKKKEKLKMNLEVPTAQEPPRIEDAEEFPNLAAASERRERADSPKFPSRQQPQNSFRSSTKKSQVPVQLDLGGLLTALEKKQRSQSAKQSSRPVVFSVGAVPVLSKEATSGKKAHRVGQQKTPHNPLDSSAPLVKKGKQREVPKAKKPTSLKKIILKERQERKQQRLQENAGSPTFPSKEVHETEGGGDEQPLEQAQPDLAGGVAEPEACAPAEESKSAEILPEPEPSCPSPDTSCPPKIHSRRFRDYCSQMLSKEVDACVTELLKELVRFQDRMYQKDPVKAKTKRRLVLGLREVLKHLKLRKLKCIIISPNCEKIQSKGGLDDTLHTIIDCACEQNIPFVFALNRKELGRSLNKAVPVSVVGIFSYDGAQDQFRRMVELTMAARQAYQALLDSVHQEPPGPPAPPSPPSPAPAGSAEPRYMEIWRKHLEAYSQCPGGLEDPLEAPASPMMKLSL
ncbi:selenocysteine insertion sequence-binding protein 2 [Sorex araneus]|uniref:selenocysteine insertion sequence-binding protein 2 n=1 Tax=Sorex araneus TaxID=42254 RepID=UPI0024336786|nr:selenocysteine insertion sequence-binding protein 2 [Sorex araneus]